MLKEHTYKKELRTTAQVRLIIDTVKNMSLASVILLYVCICKRAFGFLSFV
jgi:hypothetical protein